MQLSVVELYSLLQIINYCDAVLGQLLLVNVSLILLFVMGNVPTS